MHRQPLGHLLAQHEEHRIRRSVPDQDRRQTAIEFAESMIGPDEPECLHRVIEQRMVRRVGQQRLHAFERHQRRLDRSGGDSCDDLGHIGIAAVLDERPPRSVVHTEHQRQGSGFLGQRREDAAVQEDNTLGA